MTPAEMASKREPVMDQIGMAFNDMLQSLAPTTRSRFESRRRAVRRILAGENCRLSTLVDLASEAGYTVEVTLKKS